jgi:hypothetical protein
MCVSRGPPSNIYMYIYIEVNARPSSISLDSDDGGEKGGIL